MKQVPIKLGPIALLLTVISICLTVMTILTFSTAGADLAMSQRYADSMQSRYALEKEGQQLVQQADDILAEGGSLSSLAGLTGGRLVPGGMEQTLENGEYTLTIRLGQQGSAAEVTVWKLEKEWEQEETIHGLWQGF